MFRNEDNEKKPAKETEKEQSVRKGVMCWELREEKFKCQILIDMNIIPHYTVV